MISYRADMTRLWDPIHAEMAILKRRMDGVYRLFFCIMLAAVGTFISTLSIAVKIIFFGI